MDSYTSDEFMNMNYILRTKDKERLEKFYDSGSRESEESSKFVSKEMERLVKGKVVLHIKYVEDLNGIRWIINNQEQFYLAKKYGLDNRFIADRVYIDRKTFDNESDKNINSVRNLLVWEQKERRLKESKNNRVSYSSVDGCPRGATVCKGGCFGYDRKENKCVFKCPLGKEYPSECNDICGNYYFSNRLERYICKYIPITVV